jgi:hypothetical protein
VPKTLGVINGKTAVVWRLQTDIRLGGKQGPGQRSFTALAWASDGKHRQFSGFLPGNLGYVALYRPASLASFMQIEEIFFNLQSIA